MQRSTVPCKTEKITCETHGKWALIHSKCIKIENMPPQLAVGLCRCWLSKSSTPWWQPTLLSKPQGAARGLALSPKLVLCSSTWSRQDNGKMLCPPWWQSPRTVSSQRGPSWRGPAILTGDLIASGISISLLHRHDHGVSHFGDARHREMHRLGEIICKPFSLR